MELPGKTTVAVWKRRERSSAPEDVDGSESFQVTHCYIVVASLEKQDNLICD